MVIYSDFMAALLTTGEHPFHVLQRLRDWQDADSACALVVITHTEGGAVRAPGALLAVNQDTSFGYISGGCIDADVILQARQAIESNEPKSLRYGAGSPFVDLPLPCGGAIEVEICPKPDPAVIRQLSEALADRQRASLHLTSNSRIAAQSRSPSDERRFDYQPPLRLRIAGRGADALALATMSHAAGYETQLQLLDADDIEDARRLGLSNIQQLSSVSDLPEIEDDPWTAFVLLFHDRDLETPLLKQAVSGPAFYIGAVGSRHTHAKRCDALRAAGVTDQQIERIHGPIGLVPSLRDASSIALSTLAEIIDTAKHIPSRPESRTAFILLAAGASRRFEAGDKLLAELDGQPVLAHSAALRQSFNPGEAIAVTSPTDSGREDILTRTGWETITNPNSADGQASSIATAMNVLQSRDEIDQVVIMLGDMPNVPQNHLSEILAQAANPSIQTVMTESGGALCPPALFKRGLFDELMALSGDRGAKSVFLNSDSDTATIPLSNLEGIDIDCVDDLSRAKEFEHA